jgi:transposase-like protein
MRDWFYAINKLGINGRKGISSRELQRDIGGGKNAAWRMLQQIRKAMGNIKDREAFECIVEVDETYIGGKPRKENAQIGIDNQLIPAKKNKRGRGTKKVPVIGVRERNSNRVYIKVAMPDKDGKKLTGLQLMKIIAESTKPASTVITDDFRSYGILDNKDSKYIHVRVNHSQGEYCNSKHPWIHTNGIESIWALAKRAYYGVYHHYTLEYMQRYMDELSFRQSHRTDDRTFDVLLEQAVGA